MVTAYPKETYVPEKVTYTIEIDGKLTVIRNVPARVCVETGEQLFSAETVERIPGRKPRLFLSDKRSKPLYIAAASEILPNRRR
jgi:YgiT-type zinc finger domain-containing protein